MAVSLKHKFVSLKPDDSDATLVRPSNWNDEHALSLVGPGLVGRATGGAGAAEEISIGASLLLSGTTLSFNTTWGDARYELAFAKNTGFNKDFGTSAGTVAEGNDSRIVNGQTAYDWGDHALAGYLTEETDPVFGASAAAGIAGTDVANWNTAYDWGDHATAGYTPTSRTLTAGTGLTGGGTLAEDRTFAVDKATDANLWAGAADKVVAAAELYTANAPVTSSGSGSWAPNFAAGRKFRRTLTGASTLANPTNQVAGQEGLIYIVQDATGGRTLAYGTDWKHLNGAPTIATTANAVNVFAYYVSSAGDITLSYLGVLA